MFWGSVGLACNYLNQQDFDIKERYNYEYLCIKRPLSTNATIDFAFQKEELKNKEYFVPILMFHYIQDIPSNSRDQLGYRLSYSPQNLDKLLDALDRNNITPITFYDLKLIMEGKLKAPEKMIILSFDDWQEIASHTVSHLNTASLSNAKIYSELVDSKKFLEDKFWIKVISFSYPAWKFQNEYLKKLCSETYSFCRTTQPWTKASYKHRNILPTYRMNPTTKIEQILNLYK